MLGTASNDPLWTRALHIRAVESKPVNFGAQALHTLQALLLRARQDIALATIRAWPPHVKGAAYLWAVAFIEGRGENCAPPFGPQGAAVQ
jgi:hypothetical protein